MARRKRPKRAFLPREDHLEALAGASVLVPGLMLPADFAFAGDASAPPPQLDGWELGGAETKGERPLRLVADGASPPDAPLASIWRVEGSISRSRHTLVLDAQPLRATHIPAASSAMPASSAFASVVPAAASSAMPAQVAPLAATATPPAGPAVAWLRAAAPAPPMTPGSPGAIRPLTLAPSEPMNVPEGTNGDGLIFAGAGMMFQAMSGGEDGPTMAETADPFITASGGGSLIGGAASFLVANVGWEPFKTVSWTVSAPVMQSQSYTLPSGVTTPMDLPVVHQVDFEHWDYLSFYWGATPGDYKVTAQITYVDMSSESVSTTVTVVEPTVDAYEVSVAPAILGTHRGAIGGMITLQSPGIQYTATVTVPADTEGGEFAFLQKINGQETQNNEVSGVHTLDTGFVLDNWTGTGSPFMIQGQTFTVPAGATVSTPTRADNPGPPQDNAPNILFRGGPADGLNTGYSGIKEFQTYLVFRPSGGIWVKLAETEVYNMAGTLTWVPDDPLIPNVGKFDGNPSISKAAPDTSNGTGFVSWTDYWTNNNGPGAYAPPYTV